MIYAAVKSRLVRAHCHDTYTTVFTVKNWSLNENTVNFDLFLVISL